MVALNDCSHGLMRHYIVISQYIDIVDIGSRLMDINATIKALDNPMRMEILNWLKTPKQYFELSSQLVDADEKGVCVSIIQEKSGLSQSTVSAYMATLQRAGLVVSNRIGTWTYYQRDESNIEQFLTQLKASL